MKKEKKRKKGARKKKEREREKNRKKKKKSKALLAKSEMSWRGENTATVARREEEIMYEEAEEGRARR